MNRILTHLLVGGALAYAAVSASAFSNLGYEQPSRHQETERPLPYRPEENNVPPRQFAIIFDKTEPVAEGSSGPRRKSVN
jgi:hypothetical protein